MTQDLRPRITLRAEDIAYYTERNVGGVLSVEVHGQGCCCQHCPHGGNCRD